MFMGHLGVALGAKGTRRDVSLLLLCIAAVLPDLIDFALEGAGHADGAGLWTHSLTAMLIYAVAFFAAYALMTHRYVAALIVGMVAASHVLLDLITSRVTLWRNGPVAGFHLYAHKDWDVLLEMAVIVAGWYVYGRSLKPERRWSGAAWTILVVLIAMESVTLMVNFS
jgi:hypothetical protein